MWVLIAVAAAAMLAACPAEPPQIRIEGAKAELSPAIYGEAMVILSIRNEGGPDMLKGVRTDIPGAKASFHVTQGKRMVSVDMVEVLADSTLVFKMGGSHIMVQDMPKTMKAGSHFNLILTFEKSGEKRLSLTLESGAAMPMEDTKQM